MAVVLALDPGERRTGIAVCDAEGILARPLQTHDRKRDRSLLTLIASLIHQYQATRILVGHPLTLRGERGVRAEHAENLVRRIEAVVEIPVELVDERYTTSEASRLLAGRSAPREQRDAVAAALLLQTWLDAQREASP